MTSSVEAPTGKFPYCTYAAVQGSGRAMQRVENDRVIPTGPCTVLYGVRSTYCILLIIVRGPCTPYCMYSVLHVLRTVCTPYRTSERMGSQYRTEVPHVHTPYGTSCPHHRSRINPRGGFPAGMTQQLQVATSGSGQRDEDGLAALERAGHFLSQ